MSDWGRALLSELYSKFRDGMIRLNDESGGRRGNKWAKRIEPSMTSRWVAYAPAIDAPPCELNTFRSAGLRGFDMLRLIVAALIGVSAATSTHALDMSVTTNEAEKLVYLHMWGPIVDGDDAKFK